MRSRRPLACSRMLASIACMLAAAMCAQSSRSAEPTRKSRVYISNVAGTDSDGIYLGDFDLETGELQLVRRVAALKRASFLVLHPNQEYLFSTSEVGDFVESGGGALSAFEIDAPTGNLTLLNHQSSGGVGPCYVSLDREGKHALVANYGGGSVAVLPIGPDGRLGPATATVQHYGSSVDAVRQTGPHPHAIDVDANSRFAFVPDLGLDKVVAYRFDVATGKLTPNEASTLKTRPAAGPRHFTFHPNGRWAYFINELESTITSLQYDSDAGALAPLETISTLPDGVVTDNITGEIVIHPNGRLLYGSNRGHDSIAIFAIDQATGRIKALGQHPAGGRVPRNFNIDPSGRFLLSANLESDTVTVHRIDPVTGALSRTPHEITLPQPYCIVFTR